MSHYQMGRTQLLPCVAAPFLGKVKGAVLQSLLSREAGESPSFPAWPHTCPVGPRCGPFLVCSRSRLELHNEPAVNAGRYIKLIIEDINARARAHTHTQDTRKSR